MAQRLRDVGHRGSRRAGMSIHGSHTVGDIHGHRLRLRSETSLEGGVVQMNVYRSSDECVQGR